MLTDLGLQTQEQIDSWNNWLKTRFQPGNNFGGCIDKAICKNCNHGFRDSLCLCAGLGKCPNCGFDNSPKIENVNLQIYNNYWSGNPPQLAGDGYLNTGIGFNYSVPGITQNVTGLYTKNDFLKIVDKVSDFYCGIPYQKEICAKIKKEIEKL